MKVLGAWVGSLVVSLLVFNSCSGDDSGGAPEKVGGAQGKPSEVGDSGAGGVMLSNGGGTNDGAGTSSSGSGGDTSYAGATGCDIADQCGGCESGGFDVLCSWGEISFPGSHGSFDNYLSDYVEPEEACAAAQTTAQGGAGGSGTGGAGEPGTQTAFCDSYVEPGIRIHGCGGCTATWEETKQAECVIADECCVVVWRMGCDV